MQEDKRIKQIQKLLDVAEGNLHSARNLILDILGEKKTGKSKADHKQSAKDLSILDDGKIIEGVFDGEQMVAPDGKKYPVPANYASKSKLVEGDVLKLTIADDGSLLYKQIQPIGRKNLIGVLTYENSSFGVLAEGKNYKILFASVTYYKGKPGNNVSIIVPDGKESDWAALESVIHDHNKDEEEEAPVEEEKEKTPERKIDISEENKEILKEVEEKFSQESEPKAATKEVEEDTKSKSEDEPPPKEEKKEKEVSEESTVEDAMKEMSEDKASKDDDESEEEPDEEKHKIGVKVDDEEEKNKTIPGHPNIRKGAGSFLGEEDKVVKEEKEANSLGEKSATGGETPEEMTELEI